MTISIHPNYQPPEVQKLRINLNEVHQAFNLFIASAESAKSSHEVNRYLEKADVEAQKALELATLIIKQDVRAKEIENILYNIRMIRGTLREMIESPARFQKYKRSAML